MVVFQYLLKKGFALNRHSAYVSKFIAILILYTTNTLFIHIQTANCTSICQQLQNVSVEQAWLARLDLERSQFVFHMDGWMDDGHPSVSHKSTQHLVCWRERN